MAIDCVIPAAGASSRMGSWKPLLPWHDTTVVETVVRSALDARIACGEGRDPTQGLRVILVAGWRIEELSALFRDREGVLIAHNAGWERGMLGSIQCALPFVASGCFFVTPADMPGLVPEDYARLGKARLSLLAEGLDLPLFSSQGRKLGHPVLIPSRFKASIAGLDPEAKLRPFLLSCGARSVDGCLAACEDLDTPEDYERLRSRDPSRIAQDKGSHDL